MPARDLDPVGRALLAQPSPACYIWRVDVRWSSPRCRRGLVQALLWCALTTACACEQVPEADLITGNGDVIEPENSLIAIGSGGPYAQAAAHALIEKMSLSSYLEKKKFFHP